MSFIGSYRIFNALENGSLSAAQLETALTTDTRKLSEFKAGVVMRGLFYRAVASNNTIEAIVDSTTAIDYILQNNEADEALNYFVASDTAMGIAGDKSTVASKLVNFHLDKIISNRNTVDSFFDSDFGAAELYPKLTFTERFESITNSTIASIVYGNDLFVAAANSTSTLGIIRTSTDAITWTNRDGGNNSNSNALVYGNNLFVRAGVSGVVATSTDAITWTLRTSGSATVINALTYGSNLYVHAGASGLLRTSTDAITWTLRTSGTASIIRALTYGDNLYVYAGDGGVLATSTDAITWTARTSNVTRTINALVYGNNKYVYGSVGGAAATFVLSYSTDAITWTDVSTTTTTINSLVYTGKIFIAGKSDGDTSYSTDAITWTDVNSQSTSNLGLAYGKGVVVSGGVNGVIDSSL
jgi:hypothetical protein